MNELMLNQVPTLSWVPDFYKETFLAEIWNIYEFLVNTEEIICVHEITSHISEALILEMASHRETNGADCHLLEREILTLPVKALQDRSRYEFIDSYFDDCFRDVADALRFQHISHCHLTDPEYIREYLSHYAKEVW